jgi:hypothetical protein
MTSTPNPEYVRGSEATPQAAGGLVLTATADPDHLGLVHFTLTGTVSQATFDFDDGYPPEQRGNDGIEDPLVFDYVYDAVPATYEVRAWTATQAAASATVVVAGGETPGVAVIVSPAELEALLGLEADEAVRVSALVQLTITAYIWPNTVPDPVPPPMHAVGLALSARFAGAELTKAGSIVGETVGSYSYRLASPLTFDNVVTVLGDLADALAPWAPRHTGVYTLDVSPSELGAWPVDWWQRDLDRIYEGTF